MAWGENAIRLIFLDMQELYKIQMSMSMNKVLLKQATPVHLYTAYGCFQGCNHNEMAVDFRQVYEYFKQGFLSVMRSFIDFSKV